MSDSKIAFRKRNQLKRFKSLYLLRSKVSRLNNLAILKRQRRFEPSATSLGYRRVGALSATGCPLEAK